MNRVEVSYGECQFILLIHTSIHYWQFIIANCSLHILNCDNLQHSVCNPCI